MDTQDQIVATLRRTLEGVTGIIAVYLFGSLATGHAHALSDVDVAVLFCEGMAADERFRCLLDIGASLESALDRAVDVVSLNDAPAALRFEVLKNGLVTVENDRDERSRFVMHALNRYYDEKRYLDYQNAQLLTRLRQEGLGRGYRGNRNALSEARRLSAKLKAANDHPAG